MKEGCFHGGPYSPPPRSRTGVLGLGLFLDSSHHGPGRRIGVVQEWGLGGKCPPDSLNDCGKPLLQLQCLRALLEELDLLPKAHSEQAMWPWLFCVPTEAPWAKENGGESLEMSLGTSPP